MKSLLALLIVLVVAPCALANPPVAVQGRNHGHGHVNLRFGQAFIPQVAVVQAVPQVAVVPQAALGYGQSFAAPQCNAGLSYGAGGCNSGLGLSYGQAFAAPQVQTFAVDPYAVQTFAAPLFVQDVAFLRGGNRHVAVKVNNRPGRFTVFRRGR